MEVLSIPYPKILVRITGVFLLSFNLKLLMRRFKIKLEHLISKNEQWPSGRAPTPYTKVLGSNHWCSFTKL